VDRKTLRHTNTINYFSDVCAQQYKEFVKVLFMFCAMDRTLVL